jgi:hypothetical protein
METSLTADGRGVRHGLYAKSEKSVKARNQGVRRILNHMLAIAPWLSDSDPGGTPGMARIGTGFPRALYWLHRYPAESNKPR